MGQTCVVTDVWADMWVRSVTQISTLNDWYGVFYWWGG